MTVQIPGQPKGRPSFGPTGTPGTPNIARPLGIGDLWPSIGFAGGAGSDFNPMSDDQAGKLHVLVFIADPAKPNSKAALDAFAQKRDALADVGAEVRVVLTAAAAGDHAKTGETLPFPLAIDKTGQGFAAAGLAVTYGRLLADQAAVLAVGPNLHVLATVPANAKGNPVDAVLDRAKPMAKRRSSGVMTASHPPVLMVPDVFGPEECRKLMEIYRTTGQEFVEPGHNKLQGRTTDVKMRIPDYGRNDRIDHWVCSQETNTYIDQRLVPRLMPEIAKAFNYKVTRHERYRIACYEGERQASEHGHRDNTAPIVAHRRFAVTINLNSDDYEGAELKFPEFGDMVYKPASGTAIVCSCSILHEVMAMQSGARFALLAFLFGET